MRFVLVSALVAVSGADEICAQRGEPVSMLQTKDRGKLSKEDPVDLLQEVNAVAKSLEMDIQVEQFLDGVKDVAKVMSEANGKEILLQRASQSEKMHNLIDQFKALSDENQDKLTSASGNVFEKLPGGQKSALVQQVSLAMDESVGPKTTTRTEETAEGKSTITENRDTGYYHKHTHGDKGTDSVSRGKYGHVHRQSYSHNGRGGNARSNSISSGAGHDHSHSQSHTHIDGVANSQSSMGTKYVTGHEHSNTFGDAPTSPTPARMAPPTPATAPLAVSPCTPGNLDSYAIGYLQMAMCADPDSCTSAELLEISKVCVANGQWYYNGKSTKVGAGSWQDPCPEAELKCANNWHYPDSSVYGYGDDQAKEVVVAISAGGVHPEAPSVATAPDATPAPTLPPVTVPVVGATAETCEENDLFTTSQQCLDAAIELGFQFEKETRKNNRPKGCYKHKKQNKVWFNTHPNGGPHDKYKPICQLLSASEPQPPPPQQVRR